MKNKRNTLLLLCLLSFCLVSGQIDTSFAKTKLNYLNFLSLVGQKNLSYAAQKFSLNMSEANLELAKVFPDPIFNYGWFDNGQRRIEMGYGFITGLSLTLELGGKRKARTDLAKSEGELAKFLLQDYFRTLRADATLNYLSGLQNKYLMDVQLSSYKSMNQLATSDSLRFKVGSIGEIDARQSNLEAASMLNKVYQSEAKWKMSLLNIALFVGTRSKDTLYYPQGDFNRFDREFNLQQLIITAQNSRSDVLAALQNKDVSLKLLQLAKANRVTDVELRSGILFASHTKNVIAPTPSFSQLSAGIALPLKFSNKYAGELKMAYYSGKQSELLYQQAELQIEVEVTQAYLNYISYRKQAEQFKNGMLDEAKKILDGKTYSYQRGETSLLEVLNAQHTYDGLQTTYYETLYNYAAALVELEKAAGIWDINF